MPATPQQHEQPRLEHDTSSTSTSKQSSSTTATTTTRPPLISVVQLHNESWYDDIEQEDHQAAHCSPVSTIGSKENCAPDAATRSNDDDGDVKMEDIIIANGQPISAAAVDASLADFHVHATPVKNETSSSSSPPPPSRQIAVEFLDVSNEQKYDRLVADDKIKNPFKRRLSANSNDSRSTSPLSMNATMPSNGSSNGGNETAKMNAKKDEADGKSDAAAAAASAAGKSQSSSSGRRNNVPKRSRYEHQSQLSLASSGTSSSGGGGGGGSNHHNNQRQRKRGHPTNEPPSARPAAETETCAETLSRRQKQIDYGKNTVGYDLYVQQVPRSERTKEHPWTPTKTNKYSRRAWDGLVKVWRKKLHCWDPENATTATAVKKEEEADGDEDAAKEDVKAAAVALKAEADSDSDASSDSSEDEDEKMFKAHGTIKVEKQ